MADARPRTIDRIPWNPDLLRDQVGSGESDPELLQLPDRPKS